MILLQINKKKGFTLTEIMVVMGIIAVLVAVSVGGMMIAKKTSRNTERTVTAEEVESALAAFAAKNHGKYMAGATYGFTTDTNNFSGLVDNLISYKYLEERPKGLLSVDNGVKTDGSENQHYYYMPYGGSGNDEHYILAACAFGENVFADETGVLWDASNIPHWMLNNASDLATTTKSNFPNCREVVYFINK